MPEDRMFKEGPVTDTQHLWTKAPEPKRFTLRYGDDLHVYVTAGQRRYLHVEVAYGGEMKRHFRLLIDMEKPVWEEIVNKQAVAVDDGELAARLSMVCALFRGIIKREMRDEG